MATLESKKSILNYIPLRVHSAYSLLEGAIRVDEIVAFALQQQLPAIGIADTNNLFGALEFSQKCVEAGVQPIIGAQLSVDFADKSEKTGGQKLLPSMVFLAATQKGYAHLVELTSRAYLKKQASELPALQLEWLEELGEGIIALTGGPTGPLDRLIRQEGKQIPVLEKRLSFLQKIFDDRLYIEVSRYSKAAGYENALLELAYKASIPLVATNEAFFLKKNGYEAQDALLAIAEGQVVSNPDRRRLTPEHYLKTATEMAELFKDLPEALQNTVEIAQRCHVWAQTHAPILPVFLEQKAQKTDQFAAEAEELRRQAVLGLEERFAAGQADPLHTKEAYQERLEYELQIITQMQFPGYFLIVADFIKWAKAQGIPVGPGRGSGAGSLIAYALTITEIDPLRFSLLFERFLNPERVSMPDFDIDFCQERREEVIAYVQKKYGYEKVAQIITFGKLQARAVLRDVGRVLEMSYGQVDYLAKLVPQQPGVNITLTQSIQEEPKFSEECSKDPVVRRLLDISLQLEGLYRHASTHAAGIVIADRPLWQRVPVYYDARSTMPVTQFNMKYVEKAGLVKFDFLGLKTLTVLQKAVEFVRQEGKNIALEKIDFKDAKTYKLLSRGETVGIFQLESAGMRKALMGMRPDCIEDIIALVALYRPGPMENIPVYNARKHGEQPVDFIHPKIDALLQETYGVIIYQEQVMQIAQILAGYSLGEADLLRRAMGKKIASEMEQQRSRFIEGAAKNNVEKKRAHEVFDLLAKFANYGFNKSHAAAYAVVSYQTAYMKAHYPVAFLAASMTYDLSNTDKLNQFRQEAMRLHIRVVPPSVQTSSCFFMPEENIIYYALAAIKGIGEPVAKHIVEVRGQKPFSSLEDFCQRVDPKLVNKRALESLIFSGALDCFGKSRSELFYNLPAIMNYLNRKAEESKSGQQDFFSDLLAEEGIPFRAMAKVFSMQEELHHEFSVLGFYLSAHPLDPYQTVLQARKIPNWAQLCEQIGEGQKISVQLAGTIVGVQRRKTRQGKRLLIVQFSDTGSEFEAVFFSETLALCETQLKVGVSGIVNCSAEYRPQGISLQANAFEPLERMAPKAILHLNTNMEEVDLLPYLGEAGGGTEVSLLVPLVLEEKEQGGAEVLCKIVLPQRYTMTPEQAQFLQQRPEVSCVELLYSTGTMQFPSL